MHIINFLRVDRIINCDLFRNFAHVIHIVINTYAKDKNHRNEAPNGRGIS